MNLFLLLGDGTVMAAQNNGSTIGNAWYKLTPDASGSYVNGTWSTLASAHDTRLYYLSQVLTDGRVFVAGGETQQRRSEGRGLRPADEHLDADQPAVPDLVAVVEQLLRLQQRDPAHRAGAAHAGLPAHARHAAALRPGHEHLGATAATPPSAPGRTRRAGSSWPTTAS
ncbi:MAG: hypothetical protein H6825_00895 [Planctomycetes bacterium]|nr:hypothetical protein [Planctomycetota bacterium]